MSSGVDALIVGSKTHSQTTVFGCGKKSWFPEDMTHMISGMYWKIMFDDVLKELPVDSYHSWNVENVCSNCLWHGFPCCNCAVYVFNCVIGYGRMNGMSYIDYLIKKKHLSSLQKILKGWHGTVHQTVSDEPLITPPSV